MKVKTTQIGFRDFDKACDVARSKSLQYKDVNWFVIPHNGNGGKFAVANHDDEEKALQEYTNGKDITYLKKQVKNFRPA